MAAIEFAFVLPILLSMLLGLVELSNALGARAAVTNMASTAADLVAQKSAAAGSDMDTVFGALNVMLNGYPPNGTVITITSVIDGGAGKAPKVAWSCSWKQGGNPNGADAQPVSKGSAVPADPGMPAGLIKDGDGTSVIWARVSYTYHSLFDYFIQQPLGWKKDFWETPRRVLQIPFSGSPATSGAVCLS